jgi:hypothetical protein
MMKDSGRITVYCFFSILLLYQYVILYLGSTLVFRIKEGKSENPEVKVFFDLSPVKVNLLHIHQLDRNEDEEAKECNSGNFNDSFTLSELSELISLIKNIIIEKGRTY